MMFAGTDGDGLPDPNRYEFGGMPAIGYSSDTGLGLGALGSLTRFEEGSEPFDWRVAAQVYLSILEIGGRWELPFHDHHLTLDIPNLWSEQLRFAIGVGLVRTGNAGFFGLGNGAEIDIDRLTENPRYHQYDLVFAPITAGSWLEIWRGKESRLELYVGAGFSFVHIGVYEGSMLAEGLAGTSGEQTRNLLVVTGDYRQLTGTVGLNFDSRDHEFAPQRGMHHSVYVQGSLGLGQSFRSAATNLTSRFFFPLLDEHLVLACRLQADLDLGDVPFVFTGIGGATSIRGVIGGRYLGRMRVQANLELRSKLLPFSTMGERFNLGALLFADSGRVWADLDLHSDLDRGTSFKVGTGGGLRLQWGEAFIVRADAAYSPTDGTHGFYIDAYHIF